VQKRIEKVKNSN